MYELYIMSLNRTLIKTHIYLHFRLALIAQNDI